MWRCSSPDCDCAGLYGKWRTGDRASGTKLAEFLTPMIEEIARKKLRYSKPGEVDDVRQDTFLKLVKTGSAWSNDCPFCMWVRVIAVRIVFDHINKHQNDHKTQEFFGDPDEMADTPSQSLSPEVSECIDRRLEGLPDHLRRTYDLRVVQEMTIQEIAVLMGKQQRAIQYWMKSIREHLWPCFDAEN